MNELWEMELNLPCSEPWVFTVMKKACAQYGSDELVLNRVIVLFSREHYFLFCTGKHGERVFFHADRRGVSPPNWPLDDDDDDRSIISIPRKVVWAMFYTPTRATRLPLGVKRNLRERVIKVERNTRNIPALFK